MSHFTDGHIENDQTRELKKHHRDDLKEVLQLQDVHKAKIQLQDASTSLLHEEKSANLEQVVEIETVKLKVADDEGEWSDDESYDVKHDDQKSGVVSRIIMYSRALNLRFLAFVVSKTRGYLLTGTLLLGYLAYFIVAMCHRFGDESSYRLFGCTVLGVIIASRCYIFKLCKRLFTKVTGSEQLTPLWNRRLVTCRFFLRWLMYGAMGGVIVWIMVDRAIQDPNNLRSIPGILMILIICLICSKAPNKINYHTVFWSIGLQFLLALYVLKWKYGKDSVTWIQERISEFFDNSEAGSKLLFGNNYKDHYMIFGAFPLLFFINGMMTVLYYIGAMQLIINVIGKLLTFILGTSPVESMAVAAGVFMEGVASLTAFKPYLPGLTKSQLFLVITSCFSSIGSTFLAILNQIGVSVDLVLGAMLISAPATFTICKLLMPETCRKKDGKLSDIGDLEKNKYPSVLDAFQCGAAAMLGPFANVTVSAYALVSLISWVNKTLEWFGDRVGIENFTIELIASYVLYPVPLAMGVTLEDCRRVATVFGYRLGSSNIIAFLKLAELRRNRLRYEEYLTQYGGNATLTFINDDVILDQWGQKLTQGFVSERSEAILTYSLCGFASLLSVAIHLGIMSAFLPNRRKWLSQMCMVALLAGNLANILTGCFAYAPSIQKNIASYAHPWSESIQKMPLYPIELVTPYVPQRSLRSEDSSLLVVPRFALQTYGMRALSVHGPKKLISMQKCLKRLDLSMSDIKTAIDLTISQNFLSDTFLEALTVSRSLMRLTIMSTTMYNVTRRTSTEAWKRLTRSRPSIEAKLCFNRGTLRKMKILVLFTVQWKDYFLDNIIKSCQKLEEITLTDDHNISEIQDNIRESLTASLGSQPSSRQIRLTINGKKNDA